jgi:hypothetical protein
MGILDPRIVLKWMGAGDTSQFLDMMAVMRRHHLWPPQDPEPLSGSHR